MTFKSKVRKTVSATKTHHDSRSMVRGLYRSFYQLLIFLDLKKLLSPKRCCHFLGRYAV